MNDIKNSKNSFVYRIKLAREANMMSQAELARIVGLKPSAISHFECARREPSLANLRKLTIGLRCNADYLLGLTDRFEAEGRCEVEADEGEQETLREAVDELRSIIEWKDE